MNEFTPDELLLQKYIQNKLSEDDKEKVELWLATQPDLIDELELDEFLQQSMKQLEMSPDISKNRLNQFLSYFHKPILIFSFMLMFLTGYLFSNIFNNRIEAILSNPNVKVFDKFRSETGNISLSNTEGLLIQIQTDYLSLDTYSAHILNKHGIDIILDNLNSDDGLLTIYIKEYALQDGEYDLIIRNKKTDQKDIYKFSIKNKDI